MKLGITRKRFEQIYLSILSVGAFVLWETLVWGLFLIEAPINIGTLALFVMCSVFGLAILISALVKLEVIEFKKDKN